MIRRKQKSYPRALAARVLRTNNLDPQISQTRHIDIVNPCPDPHTPTRHRDWGQKSTRWKMIILRSEIRGSRVSWISHFSWYSSVLRWSTYYDLDRNRTRSGSISNRFRLSRTALSSSSKLIGLDRYRIVPWFIYNKLIRTSREFY